MGQNSLIDVQNLRTYFFFDEGIVKAVDGIGFTVARGSTIGVVGESGCGKSVTAQSILQIVGSGGRIVDGHIYFTPNGESIDIVRYKNSSEEIRRIRENDISMIFQEPMTSFSPVYTIGKQIAEALYFHRQITKGEARDLVVELLGKVGIPQPSKRADVYPFELSGGMRQLAMIAMSLICDPSLLIADEPTTALDVTIQAQILELLKNIQREKRMAIMIISHNLGVIADMAETVVVMYLGKIVESAPVFEIFDNPKHPYTAALLKSIPVAGDEVNARLEIIKGVVPDPYNLPRGCKFHPRCEHFMAGVCDAREPPDIEVGKGHYAGCFIFGGTDAKPK